MSLGTLLAGLLALVVGLAFAFYGFRLFLILLPIWGFFFGFLFGAGFVTSLFGDGFLSTALSWIVGFGFAVVFALLSYLYYWFAVIFLGGSIGYALGLSLMAWLNISGNLITFIVAIAFAVVFALAFIFLRVPKYLVLVATSFGGAFAAIVGIALILGRVPLAALQAGLAGAYVRDSLSFVWLAAAIVLGIVGYFYQARLVARAEIFAYSDYRNPGMSTNPLP
jgi:Domain of unknown function (DUF4203)